MNKIFVLCPTYNRRKFLPYLIYQFNYQTYSKELLTLLILDDSEKSNIDIINTINDIDLRSRIIYMHTNDKKPIGAKRNILNSIAKNLGAEYIVCFDDDDFYPPIKIESDVKMLIDSNYLIGGLNTMLIYYPHLNKIYRYGPKMTYFIKVFAKGLATNGTLVYNINYLNYGSYNNEAKYAEETQFLQKYRIKICNFNMFNYILISHNTNTVEKLQFLERGIELNIDINDLVKDNFLLNFYKNLI